MLNTTASIDIETTSAGIRTKPDAVEVPVRMQARAADPVAAAEALAELGARLSSAVDGAEVEAVTYRSWTEKLVGSGFRGRGVRFHAEAKVVIRRDCCPEAGFAERVVRLEQLRAALHPLDDGDSLHVGEARWVLRDPEPHRSAAARELGQRIDAAAKQLGLPLGAVELGELEVRVIGPDAATVRLKARVWLGQPPAGGAGAVDSSG